MARFHNTVILRGTLEYIALMKATERTLLEANEQIAHCQEALARSRETIARARKTLKAVDELLHKHHT